MDEHARESAGKASDARTILSDFPAFWHLNAIHCIVVFAFRTAISKTRN